jgi:hypothetical protein
MLLCFSFIFEYKKCSFIGKYLFIYLFLIFCDLPRDSELLIGPEQNLSKTTKLK